MPQPMASPQNSSNMADHQNHGSLASRIDVSTVNTQDACPLFTILPPEIRSYIFELALRSYYCRHKPCPIGVLYYRPGYEYERQISTSLLFTCRRIYLETHLTIFAENEISVWGGWRRSGPVSGHNKSLLPLIRTSREQQSFLTAHFLPQQYWLEDEIFSKIVLAPSFNCGTICITMRYASWWTWENRTQGHLRFDPGFGFNGWGDVVKAAKGLHTLILELETIETRKAELEAIVEQAKDWKFEQANGGVFTMDHSLTRQKTWRCVERFSKSEPPEIHQDIAYPSLHNRYCGWAEEGSLFWCRTAGGSYGWNDAGLRYLEYARHGLPEGARRSQSLTIIPEGSNNPANLSTESETTDTITTDSSALLNSNVQHDMQTSTASDRKPIELKLEREEAHGAIQASVDPILDYYIVKLVFTQRHRPSA